MAARPIPQLELHLNAFGTIFPVSKAHLLEKLGLFQEDPAGLDAAEYEVKTQVPLTVFSAFVRIVEGSPIQISNETVVGLRCLADEFHFAALSAECSAFAHQLRPGDCRDCYGWPTSAEAVRSLVDKSAFLEREIVRLSRLYAELEQRSCVHARDFGVNDNIVVGTNISLVRTVSVSGAKTFRGRSAYHF
jgi:hypothetical protein